LQSVPALKGDLGLAVLADASGVGLAEYRRSSAGGPAKPASGTNFATQDVVARALRSSGASKAAGFLRDGDRTLLAIAAPVCFGAPACSSVGVAIVGIAVDELADAASGPIRAAVSIHDANGTLLARAGDAPQARETATRRTPFEVQGARTGTFELSVPTAPAFAAARGAGVRLALVVFGAMIGVVAIGGVLSRRILAQVKPLVETNRALGRGQFDARTPVLSEDELGELARGVNQMAEQLQANYETLELRVAQRTEEVQRLLRERTELFAAISHELRTPIAIIRGQAKMMRDATYPKGTKWVTDAGTVIDDSGAQLLTLVNDVLDLTRAEAGRLDVDIETVRLPDVVRELRPTIEGLAQSSGLRAGIDVARDLPAVRADPRRLREVIVNLVDNAAKYTPEGGSVEVSAFNRNGSVVVSVSDTGVGIPPESGDLIFEPFYRVRGTRTQRGQASSGLGLALAKRIVEAQGGTITFESEIGVGTTFTFTLELA
jgi:signal transduction histidine kinase